ncbi:MAG: PKD domain-containing protein [Patescibacteria group bacterium]|nr:hypothetical protein [Patescibacteria group bacterium]MDE1945765.1 PKD domain-containing protein [Patescibacteria group bacterium]
MKNTTKYLAVAGIIFAAVFAVAMPNAAFAQDYTGTGYTDYTGTGYTDNTGYTNYTGTGYTDYTGTGYTDYTGTGYTDYTGTGYTNTTAGGVSTTYYPSYSYDGGYYGGSYAAYPSLSGGVIYPGTTIISPTIGSITANPGVSGGVLYGYGSNGYYGYNYGPLDGSCSGSLNTAVNGGTQVTWTGRATGGSGVYTYYWNGSNGLLSTGQYASQTYLSGGVASANLTITSSDGQTVTRSCSATLGNQVLAYSAANPGLQSVYLSNIPATGIGDVATVIAFLSGLLLWSAGLAYVFMKRKQSVEPVAIAATASVKTNDPIGYVTAQAFADAQAITEIESYARMNKVILSSDATKEIAKLARLGKANAKATIAKMASDEWTAVGEKDIEKYL